ncbi:hypothetical protein F511_25718 [Dorcoceras hygrometricum]|uniref:Uncharacterized protein n=1 Tax=Dorcoceras hygrometricum TaxID=472368 RepID=A0A2Z7DF18_9LAMI|nr:hypothetical protein F511_25718 [Dorcoceras hygrometricum]
MDSVCDLCWMCNLGERDLVFQVTQLAVEVSQLVMPPEMPPRRRGRARRQISIESEGQNEEVERSILIRRHARQVDDEVDLLAARVDEMELIMVRFQLMNPQTFNGGESSSNEDSWLQHITRLFDRVRYDDERRLSLATFH